MKKKGFTLIELLAVIALIATPKFLNVVDNARESATKNSVGVYANATRLEIYDYQFANNGTYPKADKIWQKVLCMLCHRSSQTEQQRCDEAGVRPVLYLNGSTILTFASEEDTAENPFMLGE